MYLVTVSFSIQKIIMFTLILGGVAVLVIVILMIIISAKNKKDKEDRGEKTTLGDNPQ